MDFHEVGFVGHAEDDVLHVVGLRRVVRDDVRQFGIGAVNIVVTGIEGEVVHVVGR